MLKLIYGALIALVWALPSAAQQCGDAEIPCEIGGGIYHAAIPDGPGLHPAVIFMHGYGGRASKTIANKSLIRQFLERGYAVIAPQAMPRAGNNRASWNAFASPQRRNDVEFVRAAMADATARFGLDHTRVVAAGFSGGGMMVWRIACDAPGDYAAYAPVAGLMWRPLPDKCAGPIRMLHTHGWTDPVVPIEGRSVAGGRITQGDLFVGLNLLREASGCARDNPDNMVAKGQYWRRQWTDCATNASLEFALHPGGHSIPKGWVAMTLDWFEEFSPNPIAMCQKEETTEAVC